MRPSDLIRLLLLAAIWGASFLFMRVAAPEFGPVPLILVRVGVAMLCLLPFLLRPANHEHLRVQWKTLAMVGVMNSALPFSLLAFATLSLEAGFTALLNASTPFFAAAIGFAWLRLPLTRLQGLGMLFGICGITILAWGHLSFKPGGTGWAIVAALSAGIAYGWSAHMTKRRLSELPAEVFAGGCLLAGTLVLLPISIPLWPELTPSPKAWGCAMALAVLSTAIAYMLFFRLVTRIGATASASVTFIIPVFAIIWGRIFLQEEMTGQMLGGMVITLVGTAFATGLIHAKRVKI